MTLHLHFEAPATRIARRPRPAADAASFRVVDAGLGEARPSPRAAVDAGARPGGVIGSSAGSRVLRRAIGGVDGFLSRCCGVVPFSGEERCLLRCATIPSPGAYRLSDGTVLAAGDVVLDLHLWNEHIPPVPKGGPDLAWARLMAQRMRHSLALLAEAVDGRAELRGARAIRARINFVGWGRPGESLSRLIGRFGFEDVDEGPASAPALLHDAFENILIGALTWAHNPEALRGDKLVRRRRPVWMSTDALRRNYSGG